jgi:hypothetical protein
MMKLRYHRLAGYARSLLLLHLFPIAGAGQPADQTWRCATSAICCMHYEITSVAPTSELSPPLLPRSRAATVVMLRGRFCRNAHNIHPGCGLTVRCCVCSHVKFSLCVPGDPSQQWDIDSGSIKTGAATKIISSVDGRCLQPDNCESGSGGGGTYARVVVDSCDISLPVCGNKHTQWLPSSGAAGVLGFQNAAPPPDHPHMCLNNIGTWPVPDGLGPTWVCTWGSGVTACGVAEANCLVCDCALSCLRAQAPFVTLSAVSPPNLPN